WRRRKAASSGASAFGWRSRRARRRNSIPSRADQSHILRGRGSVILLPIAGTQAFLLQDRRYVLDNAFVPAEIDREVLHGRNARLHQRGHSSAFTGPVVLGTGQRGHEGEVRMGASQGLQLVLVVEVPLTAKAPVEGDRAREPALGQSVEHRARGGDPRGGRDKPDAARGVVAQV